MTAQQIWTRTERYLEKTLCDTDTDLARAADSVHVHRLPRISVAELQGKQIAFLAAMIGARRVLEIGTLAGHSTLWLAGAVGDGGTVVTVENNPLHAAAARANFDRARLGTRVQIRVGNAVDELAALLEDGVEPFDFFFIDADQHNNVRYLEGCVALGRSGSLIVVDNVVRGGEVADPLTTNPAVRATREMLDIVAESRALDGVVFQTVGSRGHDGMLVVRLA